MKQKKKSIIPEACSCTIIHQDRIDRASKQMPKTEVLFNLAELFKSFGDTTRIRILYSLFKEEMCVCDLCAFLGMTQSSISHQLRILKLSRLVRSRKAGKVVYYSLEDVHIKDIFKLGLIHINE
ncbi:MAG: transcriptional regulator [Bdellovibrionales bacterium RIFOXYB1_FULL_37_110]|nr:MAG: transcriptional regulator [Bdellovibrionales bacterium RIFOXYC1_FULL_37_79]OFZ60147.1 MAG: transcriptional regulator [Bdellovibrionales bacterium RIFOXYB1_FULL_37_110]OFZ64359.1 MAG: transcriptional regulator [Bdellovibrionales bacterium RIFOXYD1_FULL_36_51]